MKYYKVKFDSPFGGVDEYFVVAGENITSDDVESYIQDDYEQFVYDIETDDRCVDIDEDDDEYYNICEQIESECEYKIEEVGEDEASLYNIYIYN
jgi:hypothetical protein